MQGLSPYAPVGRYPHARRLRAETKQVWVLASFLCRSAKDFVRKGLSIALPYHRESDLRIGASQGIDHS